MTRAQLCIFVKTTSTLAAVQANPYQYLLFTIIKTHSERLEGLDRAEREKCPCCKFLYSSISSPNIEYLYYFVQETYKELCQIL